MNLTFNASLEKEYTNYLCGRGSVNHPKSHMTEIDKEMVERGIDRDSKTAVLAFFEQKLKNSDLDVDQKIESLAAGWQKIAAEVEKRFQKLFDTDIDLGEVTAYLTLQSRCGYNTDGKFFFVSVFRNHPNNTCVHELMHFYTHILYEKNFKELDLPYQDFNDFKEALTFLINTDFQDLLDDTDRGYEIQKGLRAFMAEKWPECETIDDLAKIVIELFLSQEHKKNGSVDPDLLDDYDK